MNARDRGRWTHERALRAHRAVQSSFLPTSLGGCVLWLDAGQAGGSDGSNLTSWPDVSGAGFHLNGQDAANVFHSSGGPNGKSYVQFSAGALYRTTPCLGAADAARSCFLIVKRDADGHIAWLDGRYGYNGFGQSFGIGTSNKREVTLSGVSYPYDTTNDATSAWEKHSVINAANGTQQLRVGGSAHTLSASAASLAATSRFSLGGNDNAFAPSAFVGGIAEFLMYDRVLTGDEIAAVESYLLSKYGV